jgi:hypothetical protein
MPPRAFLAVVLVSAVLRGPSASTASAGEEFWTWTSLDVWQSDPWSLHLLLDNRIAEGRGSYLQLVTPKLDLALSPWLTAASGLGCLWIEPVSGGDPVSQGRLELELNPAFPVGDWRLHLRNRWEIRYPEWRGAPSHRFRHRIQVSRKLDHPGPLSAFSASNEVFVDLEENLWTENRLIPASLTFPLTSQVRVDLFWMIRSSRSAGEEWSQDQIAGTFLHLSL